MSLNSEESYTELNNEILGPEDIEKYAAEIAKGHLVKKNSRFPRGLIGRMNKNYRYILDVYKGLTKNGQEVFPSSPTAEWLLDNFYIIEEQVKDIRLNLSKKYYSQLPVLNNGEFKGYPRAYVIAKELVAHSDGKIDEKTLAGFVQAYQSNNFLSIGELWAIAMMLRIALVENIKIICERIVASQRDYERAEEITELIVSNINQGEEELLKIIKGQISSKDILSSGFVEHLLQRLRNQGSKTAVVISYIDDILKEKDFSVERAASLEHRIKAARQVSMGNSITSLRLISAMDWHDIFESLSQVENILKDDPSGVYLQMDFDSRDSYRHEVEKIALLYDAAEISVAQKAIECAKEAPSENENISVKHVGYYLRGKGRSLLEKKIGNKHRGIRGSLETVIKHPYLLYFGLIGLLITGLVNGLLYYGLRNQGFVTPMIFLLTGLIILIPISDISISIVNFVVSYLYKPTTLPKLELKQGITSDLSTMVIIPTLLPNEKRVNELLEQLEISYLANREKHLYFALVGDFKDGSTSEQGDDSKIINIALTGIKNLNARYATGEEDIFYYFHRCRKFNPSQNKWMGWERKRGAILELNDLLQGSADTTYNVASCDLANIPRVKYVITLDADTNLSIGTAKRLIGTLAHPLNKAVINWDKGIVTEGYGILQPRIGINLNSANCSLFTRIFAGQGGIDPYTTAVFDVYQDLFGEGIFTGKGIYELDTFQGLLKNAIPENAILSHDLLEGSYIRAGLVTDIELIDGYPGGYHSFAMRQHRWVRGDWQLTPWLASKVKDKEGNWRENPLSPLAKWKIFDNLRRSLVSPTLFVLIALSFSVLSSNSILWLSLAVITTIFPALMYLLGTLFGKNLHFINRSVNSTVIWGFKAAVYQGGLQLIFVPYQAYLMFDAVARTIFRVVFTKKNMLEWVTAADLETTLKNDVSSFVKRMWISPVFGIVIMILGMRFAPNISPLAAVLMILWAGAPYIAYKISQRYIRDRKILNQESNQELRRLARKTWAYFEDLVTSTENYLPPDNFQVDPPNGIAHRTSPTNIGMLLVSTATARDLGYIGTLEMFERIEASLQTIERMEKWEGHLYNWYDTISLEVLKPRYISTVDSGNFIGYLMVLEQTLQEYLNKPFIDISMAQGLNDTIYLLNEDIGDTGLSINTGPIDKFITDGKIEEVHWRDLLETIRSEALSNNLHERVRKSPWGKRLLNMLNNFTRELEENKVKNINELYQSLISTINKLIENTKFAPLYDPKRQLFSIGYNVEEGMLTKSYYDLLASEARQASYIAIARGEVDKKHWFRLGRKLTQMDGGKGLLSWTGTMFEYLMPLLIMGNYENSLLDETYTFVVEAQKRYGMKRKIPWGTSESAYYAFDINLNYQYKAFGVPELGFKRGLANDMVVAPYASVLALLVDPQGAMDNIKRLLTDGLDGEYGLYEAIDYTPVRLAESKGNIIKNFMVHHQGMSILALNNYLNENIMQARFHANPIIRSAEVLLQERIPTRAIISKEYKDDFVPTRRVEYEDGAAIRKFGIPDSELPKMHLLSNGAYSVMVTNGGSGYSKNRDMAVSRWKGDLRGTNTGIYIYIQNINANNVWSATFEPYKDIPEDYAVVFSPDKAKFTRKDGNIETNTEIVVSPEDNAEIRKVSLTNHSEYSRVIEVTSYLEVVLTHPDADIAHPAFSNLFVTTEYVPEYNSLLASRRPRSEGQKTVWAVHTVAVEGEVVGDIQYETDRAKFIGRNRDLSNPVAMDVDQPLSNTVGAVLDPVMCIRKRIKIEPGQTVRLSYTVAVADNRKSALVIADKYRDLRTIERAYEMAWNRSQIEARFLGLKASEMEQYLNMVPSILFAGPTRQKWGDVIQKNRKGQPGLWLYGISGDIPIVLVTISDKENLAKVYDLLKAHEYWRMKGLTVDLVVLVEDESGYSQPLQDKVRDTVSATHARDMIGKNGGVFMINAELMPEEDKILLYTVARIIIKGNDGPIEEQLGWEKSTNIESRSVAASFSKDEKLTSSNKLPYPSFDTSQLEFFNGLGGFSQEGKEYIIYLRQGQHTPAPWINVISNQQFGFNISEVGAGYTWAENSRENKITPWFNDPVSDNLGEIFYLRDENQGNYWSITPMPIREKEDYIIRHGQGYTTFEHISHEIEQTLTEFVTLEDPVKMCIVSLKNTSEASRELSLTYYIRPVMGVNEKVNSQFITTGTFGEKGILLINNSYSSDFPGRIVFIDSSELQRTVTGDREEFIGINRSLDNPEIMEKGQLSGRLGAGLDPCGAMQVKVNLSSGEKKEIVFILGQGRDIAEVTGFTDKYSNINAAQGELARVRKFWQEKLGAIQVRTPDKSLDFLLNGWLQYQVISCRLWSRAAFYQSGGAYGFRDQLQDVMSVVYTWPEVARKQILLHSAHQFPEGDVQHWWHPGVDKGIRTRYSDDLLWLPYVTADYIQTTEDWGVLDEETNFLESEPLQEHEDERYDIPRISEEKADVYEHCVRAIEKALKFGDHGIPLMGSGDWNDGMNTVGNKGQGESIWLGWFLYTVLQRFIPICIARKDEARADRYGRIAEEISQAIERHGWDGSWYRRAYFDDGKPLGSAQNTECKIDAIAQSWSIISGVGRPHRAEEAMNAVENYLVDKQAGIIKLLTPPFQEGNLEPGYIKSYIPGVRENGGQYTHAAVWTVMAFAKLGKGDKVGELFHLINPINHARTPIECGRYKVEPYVVAADVYAVHPNTGRGGWSWYTGAAGWMYRLGIEYIIGMKKLGNNISFDPCIPREWHGFEVEYQYKNTLYHIRVKNPEGISKGVQRVTLDGTIYQDGLVELKDDGIEHLIEVVMGEIKTDERESLKEETAAQGTVKETIKQ